MMTINERIKELRKKLNLPQTKFAKAIAISNGYLAEIELGNRPVNERLIKLICYTFNVSSNWLCNGLGEMFLPESNLLTEQALTSFKELNPIYQKYILQQIDELLKIQNKQIL